MTTLAVILLSLFAFFILNFLKKLSYSPDKSNFTLFKDSDGIKYIYHGVNICNYSKHSPDLLPWMTKEDYSRLNKWGFNLVRFLVFWEAVEPEKGKYDTAYLSKLTEHLNILDSLGIKVIIDVHQDLFSKKYSGNGFPLWAAQDGGKPFKKIKGPWLLNYFQAAPRACCNNFWESKELRNKYIAMIDYLVTYLQGQRNVIGIDVMNEPFPPLMKLLSFEKKVLTPFYCDILMKIKNMTKCLFVEPAIYCSTGFPSNIGKITLRNSAGYMPHYYDVFCHENKPYGFLNKILMKRSLAIKARESQLINSPFLIGEFGMSEKVKNFKKYIKDFCGIMDSYCGSWCWYCYDKTTFSANGLIDEAGNETNLLHSLVRVYPQQIAGSNPSYSFDGNIFRLTYNNHTNEQKRKAGQTTVFIPDDFDYEIESNADYSVEGNIAIFKNKGTATQTIIIRRK